MFKIQKIIVPLDGSELAERAIAPSITLANAMAAKVLFLTVVKPFPSRVDTYQHGLKKEIVKTRRYLRSVQTRFPGVPVCGRAETIVGIDVAKSIIRYSKQHDADLIVMANRGRSGISRLVIGSVSEEVLHGASCSTMIICVQADNEPSSFNRILVPLDGTSLAEQALEPAAAIAESLLAELVLLHIVRSPTEPKETVRLLQPYELGVMVNEVVIDSYLREVHSRVSDGCLSIKFATSVGLPPKAIVDYARENSVDLIVMSGHSRSGLSRWVYGSVAENVLRGSKCATLVIRERESIYKEGLVHVEGI